MTFVFLQVELPDNLLNLKEATDDLAKRVNGKVFMLSSHSSEEHSVLLDREQDEDTELIRALEERGYEVRKVSDEVHVSRMLEGFKFFIDATVRTGNEQVSGSERPSYIADHLVQNCKYCGTPNASPEHTNYRCNGCGELLKW